MAIFFMKIAILCIFDNQTGSHRAGFLGCNLQSGKLSFSPGMSLVLVLIVVLILIIVLVLIVVLVLIIVVFILIV